MSLKKEFKDFKDAAEKKRGELEEKIANEEAAGKSAKELFDELQKEHIESEQARAEQVEKIKELNEQVVGICSEGKLLPFPRALTLDEIKESKLADLSMYDIEDEVAEVLRDCIRQTVDSGAGFDFNAFGSGVIVS